MFLPSNLTIQLQSYIHSPFFTLHLKPLPHRPLIPLFPSYSIKIYLSQPTFFLHSQTSILQSLIIANGFYTIIPTNPKFTL